MKRLSWSLLLILAAGVCPPAGAQPRIEPSTVDAPAPQLVPGYRAFSLPLPWHQLTFLKKGQRVDVLVTFEAVMKGDVKEKVTATILQDVVVLDLLKPEQSDGRGVLEILVNPNEAQYAALSVLQGDVRVTARAEGDVAMHPMEMASFPQALQIGLETLVCAAGSHPAARRVEG